MTGDTTFLYLKKYFPSYFLCLEAGSIVTATSVCFLLCRAQPMSGGVTNNRIVGVMVVTLTEPLVSERVLCSVLGMGFISVSFPRSLPIFSFVWWENWGLEKVSSSLTLYKVAGLGFRAREGALYKVPEGWAAVWESMGTRVEEKA